MHRDILFVDDEPLLLTYVERRLRGSFNVFTAMSGRRGLELIGDRPQPFSVVVTDLRMPEMDGLEFIEAAREKLPRTEFLVLTACARGFALSEAVDRGRVSVLLSKSCENPLLTLAIEQAIQRYELVVGDEAFEDDSQFRSLAGEVRASNETTHRAAGRPLEFYMLEPRVSLTWAERRELAAAISFSLPRPQSQSERDDEARS